MTERTAYQSPRDIATRLVNEIVPDEFSRFRGALKTAFVRAIIDRDSYWMKRKTLADGEKAGGKQEG